MPGTVAIPKPSGCNLTKNFKLFTDMKRLKFLALLSTSFLLMSCEKEGEKNIALDRFLSRTELQFEGNVMEEEVNWFFSNWDNGIGAYSESYWCLTADKKIQQRNFAIYDYNKRKEIFLIKIKSPAFSIDSSYNFKKSIFDLGIKNIKDSEDRIFDGFDIEVSSTYGMVSTIYGDQKSSSLEVLKLVEEATSAEYQDDYKAVKVWFLISCKLYKPNGELAGKIKDGMLLGFFQIESNGNLEIDKHLKVDEKNDCGCKMQKVK